MRKHIPVCLFFCLVLPFFGTYTWLKLEKYKVRKTIKWRMIEGVDKEELVLLKFTREASETELRWEHSREFEYNGEMYDVVEKSTEGDTIYYYCWWDSEETRLNRQLSELVINALGQNPLNKEKQDRLSNFQKHLYSENSDNRISSANESFKILFIGYQFQFLSIYFSPPTPPPEAG